MTRKTLGNSSASILGGLARRFLPAATTERLADLRRRLHSLSDTGDAVSCPMCGGRFSSFLEAGEKHPIFDKHVFVAGGFRPNVRCPRCGCRDRERLVYLYLREALNRARTGEGARVLHFAPERRLERYLRGLQCDYTTADLDGSRVDRCIDVTDIPFDDGTFDLLLCNHVLEHVPDDGAALNEIARVLSPKGIAILQVPHATDLTVTYEDASIVSEAARMDAFGQVDHVRIYGRDYVSRLSSQALRCDTWLPDKHVLAEHGIDAADPLIVGRRADFKEIVLPDTQ